MSLLVEIRSFVSSERFGSRQIGAVGLYASHSGLRAVFRRLHGVCRANPLASLVARLRLPMYRTSGDNSVLYDHDLERCPLLHYLCLRLTFYATLYLLHVV